MSKRVNNKKGNRAVRKKSPPHATKVRANSKPFRSVGGVYGGGVPETFKELFGF